MRESLKRLLIVDEQLEFANHIFQIRSHFGDGLAIFMSCDMSDAVQNYSELEQYDVVLVVEGEQSGAVECLLEANFLRQSNLNIGVVSRSQNAEELRQLVDLNAKGAFVLGISGEDLINGLEEMMAGRLYFPGLWVEETASLAGDSANACGRVLHLAKTGVVPCARTSFWPII